MLYEAIRRSTVDQNPIYQQAYQLMLEGMNYRQIGEQLKCSPTTAARYVCGYETHYGTAYLMIWKSRVVKSDGSFLTTRRAFKAANDKRAIRLVRSEIMPEYRNEIVVKRADQKTVENLERFAGHYEHFMFTKTGEFIHRRKHNTIKRRREIQEQRAKQRLICQHCQGTGRVQFANASSSS